MAFNEQLQHVLVMLELFPTFLQTFYICSHPYTPHCGLL